MVGRRTGPSGRAAIGLVMALSALSVAKPATAQSRAAVERERAAHARWLRESPDSPLPAADRETYQPGWYPYDSGPVFLTRMRTAATPEVVPLVSAEGVLIRMTRLGTVTISVGGEVVTLPVFRVPIAGELTYQVHLRDASNGQTTHPAGRFIDLIALGDDRFLIDTNRARQPWCAYAPRLPCPEAWPGESVNAWVQVGEYLPSLIRR